MAVIVSGSVNSQLLEVLSPNSLLGDDSGVGSLKGFGLHESVLIGAHELPLVVSAPITNYDLRRVLVGHHDSRLGQSRSEGVGVIGRQWLLQHAGMQRVSLLKGLSREGRRLGELVGRCVHGLGCPVVEGHADVEAALLEHLGAGGDTRVLEHGRRVPNLLLVVGHVLLKA